MAFFLLFLLLVSTFLGTDAAVFTLQNRCNETIWPGILARDGYSRLLNGDIWLNPGQTLTLTAPTSWVGQVWARTGCSSDQAGRLMNCATGDCGSGGSMEECGRPNTTPPPTTVADFFLDWPMDNYYVSLIDGFNVPISIVPSGGSAGECRPLSCVVDLNLRCPSTLQVRSVYGRVVACKSACLAFNRPEYCCTGAYGGTSPDACRPSSYSLFFKDSCPVALTYPRDDPSSVGTCRGADYLISFC